eukprot:gene9017-9764_t
MKNNPLDFLHLKSLYLLLLCFSLYWNDSYGSFYFKDFNETAGLVFVGTAGTTNCYNYTLNNYGDYQGVADLFNEDESIERGETTVLISESNVETNNATTTTTVNTQLAGFLNRNDTQAAPTQCDVRIRLTPSGPSKAGAVWFNEPAPVSHGFDTIFTFQITDHSKECTLNKDQYFTMKHHTTCSIRGADGFALVIQNSVNGTKSLGGLGGLMGFGGIDNSLAIAFDIWQNQGEDRLGVDHVSIQSLGNSANDAYETGLLGVPRAHTLADGNIHRARVTYYGELKSQYFNQLVASDSLLPYLKDNGEQKRIGTLLVYVDDGIDSDVPLLALPINLSLLLRMPTDRAYIGFTSSTGRFYAKHDILSWKWCDESPCTDPSFYELDFHQKSKIFASKVQSFVPGSGYGGGDVDGFPTKNESPDTDPWTLPVSSFSKSRNHGLSEVADQEIPPNTLY